MEGGRCFRTGAYDIENIRLIYPKETNVDKSKSSALYIQLDNNIVKDVQTYELLSKDEKENIKLRKTWCFLQLIIYETNVIKV